MCSSDLPFSGTARRPLPRMASECIEETSLVKVFGLVCWSDVVSEGDGELYLGSAPSVLPLRAGMARELALRPMWFCK